MTWRALVVDDDPEMLASLLMRGRKHRQSWTFVSAQGGQAALEKLRNDKFDLLLTDLTMPGTSGGTVLSTAREVAPETARFVLSGRSDRWMAKEASAAHQIFTKPADLDEVLGQAESVIKARAFLDSSEIRAVTSGEGAPPSPRIFAALRAALSEPDYDLNSVARIVEQDMTVMGRVLQLASSSALGPRRKVASVREAVVALGKDAIEQLVLLEELMGAQPAQERDALRDHALLVGRFASALMPECQESFVAGVLHDVGHLMCSEPDTARGRHGYLGSYAAALWGFPINVVDAIREHHRPPWGKQANLSSALWLADRIADNGPSALEDPLLTRFDPNLTLRWREVGFRILQQEPNKQEDAHRAAGCHR